MSVCCRGRLSAIFNVVRHSEKMVNVGKKDTRRLSTSGIEYYVRKEKKIVKGGELGHG